MQTARRSFILGSAAAFSGLARAQETASGMAADTYTNQVAGYGPLVRDPAGVFDLPRGFSYTIVSQAGELMSDGLVTPHKFDGMGCFAGSDGQVILVRNHELKSSDRGLGAFGADEQLAHPPAHLVYDRREDGSPFPGGTTTVVYDPRTQRLVSQHLSLAGTAVNCAGGVTPRNTWLSCEETLQAKGVEAQADHGWVFEVPAAHRGLVEPRPIRGLGRFRHEAAATDPRTGIVYLTEDQSDGAGLFYRFLPNDAANLFAGGKLQALGFADRDADARNWDQPWWRPGDRRPVVWIDLDGVDNPFEDLRHRGHAAGAAWFARGEGIFFGQDELYFTCTNGGAGGLGQIMRYRPSRFEGQPGERGEPGMIELHVEPSDRKVMDMADNIAIAPWGHLFVCEDRTGVNHLKAITPAGQVYTVGRNAAATDNSGGNTELAGVCFSPDGSTMFVNLYFPGATLAITGPWASFSA